MNLIDLYFNPSGRIKRSTFWLKGVLLLRLMWFVIGVLEVILVVTLISDMTLAEYYEVLRFNLSISLHEFATGLVTGSVGVHSLAGLMKTLIFDAGSVFRDLDIVQVLAATSISLMLSLIDTWTTYAVIAKRLHDTDRPAWWALAWAGVYLVGTLTVAFIVGWFVWLALLVWILVWLGFKEGSSDRNRYGEPQQTTGEARSAGQPRAVPRPATPQSPHWMFRLSAILSVIFAALVIVAAFFPWITVSAFFSREHVSGIEGYHGIFTLLMGATAGGIVLFGLSRERTRQTVVIGAVVCFLLGVAITIDALLVILGAGSSRYVEILVGPKITLVGGIGLAVANSGWLLSLLLVPIRMGQYERGGGQPSRYGLHTAADETRYGPPERPIPRTPGNAIPGGMKTCPYCAESIPYEELRCRYCDSEVPGEAD